MLSSAQPARSHRFARVGALAALALALAAPGRSVPAEPPAPQPQPEQAQGKEREQDAQQTSPPEVLEDQVDSLNRRVQGMAGKLKESAIARKGADQARMEAERRLAEVVAENHRLSAELRLLRDGKLALEVQLSRAQEREAKTLAALESARDANEVLSDERDAGRRRVAELQRELDSERRGRLDEQAKQQERVDALERTLAELRRDLRGSSTQIQRLKARLDGAGAERETLSRRLDEMRSMIPAAEGGSLTLDGARARASDAAETLRSVAAASSRQSSAGRRDLREAELDLHRFQLAVARVSAARGVYRVRPHDSLGLIARRFYGDSERWREIGEANLHVLADPDRLIPGMTLVVP